MQPGVLYLGNPAENDTIDSRSGSVSGGRSDQGNITLDGMDDNDQIKRNRVHRRAAFDPGFD
jgi:hypothetical protein